MNTPASGYGLNTGVSGPFTGGLPRIGFAGAFVPGLGGFKWPKFQGPDSITQFIDHVSYTAGKHSLKFGGELHRNEVTGGAFGNARGSITFLGGVAIGTGAGSTALEDFFAGDPFKASVQVGDPTLHIHNWAYGLFAQDDWRATKNLTLNFGVRYEYSSVIKEAHNLLGNFDPNSATGLIQAGIGGVSGPYNPDHKNFAPRLGFAWDVNGKGKHGLTRRRRPGVRNHQLGSAARLQQRLRPQQRSHGRHHRCCGRHRRRHDHGRQSRDSARHAAVGQRRAHLWRQRQHGHSELLQQSLPHHERGPQHHHSLRLELDS